MSSVQDFEGHFIAKNGQTTIVEAPMLEIKTPYYETWWFWTGLGVLTAGTLTFFIIKESNKNELKNSISVNYKGAPEEFLDINEKSATK